MSLPYASALSPSVSQTEFNSHARREIHRLTLAFCRLEFDLLRCASCCFIQTVAQTAYHAVHLNAAAREEYHLENNVTFDLQSTPFRGVLRTWFVQDVNRRCSTFGGRGSLLGRFGRDCLIREAGALQCAALGAAWRRIRYAVSESRPARQCRRTKAIDVRGFVWITLTWDSVGIAEAAGLHFVHRGHDRRRGCAA